MKFVIVLFLFFGMVCSAQKADYRSTLKKMDSLNQVKLDTGIDMMSTERSYFLELHQLMNEVYHDLLKHKTSQDFEKEQMEWLQFFEEKSIKIWKPINESVEKNEWLGLDAQLIVYGQQADLVHERIIVLINQF